MGQSLSAERIDAFLGQFVLPLVGGGEVHVGQPLDADDLAELCDYLALRDEQVMGIEATCLQRAAELWLFPVQPRLDATALRLMVAAHNLLFLSHPVSAKWRVGQRGRGRIEGFIRRCLELPPPASDSALVERHIFVGHLVRLRRMDTKIRFWLGSYDFVGQQPPPRLLRFPQLRRVRESRWQVSWLGSELSEAQLELLNLLFYQSPLTDLLTPDREAPPFSWLSLCPCLSSRWVARLVCHHYLERGLGEVGPALARAFWALAASQAHGRQAALRAVCGLVAYLLALFYLTRDPTAEETDRLTANTPEASLESVLVAGARCGILPPPESLADTEVAARLDQWIASSQQTLGPAADQLTHQLQAALR